LLANPEDMSVKMLNDYHAREIAVDIEQIKQLMMGEKAKKESI
jgi:hypothetical protein